MTAFLLWLASQIWPYVVGALGVVAVIFQQRQAGAKAERAKQAEREAEARDVADQIDNDVGAIPGAQVRKELGLWRKH